MGFDVHLQTESGDVLDSISERGILTRLLPNGGFSFLAGIDRYDDTTFNRLQMATFLQEWGHLREKAKTPEERKLLDDIESLALRCDGGLHLYLKFVGD